MTEHSVEAHDWGAYYRAVGARPPRDLFRQTMQRFSASDPASRLAIDLGCGAGNETTALLDLGWRVLAVDLHPEALAGVHRLTKPDQQSRLTTQMASFKDAQLPPSDFIWASASLPFAAPEDFPFIWERILTSLKSGGRFAGDFFGPRHAWAGRKYMNFHTVEEVEVLCRSLHVEYLISEEGEKITATDGPLHWHACSIVARKL